MQKLQIIILLYLGTCFTSMAQDTTSVKASKGDWNVEVNFDPFSDRPIGINYLRARFFKNSNFAYRLGISVSGETQIPSDEVKLSTYTINLRPGIEKHFNGTNRLSPFIGAEVDFAIKNSERQNDIGPDIDGAWGTLGQERGYTRIGLNVITGVDIYIIKNLYIGTEIGYGFELETAADIEIENVQEKDEGGSSFQFGPNFNSSIRLGFIF